MTGNYEPTVGDLWPNPESAPPEVRKIFTEMAQHADEELARIDANPYQISKSWWQVTTTDHGSVKQVCVNKPVGRAAGQWTFEPTIDDEGVPLIHVQQSRYIDELWATPVATWHLPANLSDRDLTDALTALVGLRTARGVTKRLRQKN